MFVVHRSTDSLVSDVDVDDNVVRNTHSTQKYDH